VCWVRSISGSNMWVINLTRITHILTAMFARGRDPLGSVRSLRTYLVCVTTALMAPLCCQGVRARLLRMRPASHTAGH
jgi:hypothetical protein